MVALITALPTPPSTSSPTTFATKADAFVAALPQFVTDANALSTEVNSESTTANTAATSAIASAATASAAQTALASSAATQATSATSLTIETGTKTLTVTTAKNFLVGMPVRISDSTGLNYMDGNVTAYNSGTGVMSVLVTNSVGAGTIASWTVSLIGNSKVSDLRGFKNLLIGGDFATNPWQRGTSFNSSGIIYGPDRWAINPNSGVADISCTKQLLANGKTACRMQRIAGQTAVNGGILEQTIEIANAQDLAGSNVTLSFDAVAGANYSNATSSILATITFGTGTTDTKVESFTGSTSTNFNIVISTTETRYSVTFAVPVGTTQIAPRFTAGPWAGTAGANDYIDIIDVQLERGSIATPMERRPVGIEQALCLRYFYASPTTMLPGINLFYGDVVSGHTYYAMLEFPVRMRVSPTVALTNIAVICFPTTPGTPSASIYGVFESRVANATSTGVFESSILADAEIY